MKLGIALRPTVVSPCEIVKLSKIIDQSQVTHLFVPDPPQTYDILGICSACLGVSKGLQVGSGVIRFQEYEEKVLLRRLETLQALSENRFVLGVGVGRPGTSPQDAIKKMLDYVHALRNDFRSYKGLQFPITFVAALRKGIAQKSLQEAEGILLNFCSANYVRRLVGDLGQDRLRSKEIACYLKVFYSKSRETATRLMVEEFSKYDQVTNYHEMFKLDGIDQDIKSAQHSLERDTHEIPPPAMSKISPINPTTQELSSYVAEYRKAGLTIPVVYPYFSETDNFEFKEEILRSVISLSGG